MLRLSCTIVVQSAHCISVLFAFLLKSVRNVILPIISFWMFPLISVKCVSWKAVLSAVLSINVLPVIWTVLITLPMSQILTVLTAILHWTSSLIRHPNTAKCVHWKDVSDATTYFSAKHAFREHTFSMRHLFYANRVSCKAACNATVSQNAISAMLKNSILWMSVMVDASNASPVSAQKAEQSKTKQCQQFCIRKNNAKFRQTYKSWRWLSAYAVTLLCSLLWSVSK